MYNPTDYPFVKSWNNGGTGILIGNTADYARYDGPYVIQTRLTTWDPASETDKAEIVDVFTMTLMDECRHAIVTTPMTGLDSEYEWFMWERQVVKVGTIQLNVTHNCPVTYEITDKNYERTPVDSSLYRITNAGTPTMQIEGTWFD